MPSYLYHKQIYKFSNHKYLLSNLEFNSRNSVGLGVFLGYTPSSWAVDDENDWVLQACFPVNHGSLFRYDKMSVSRKNNAVEFCYDDRYRKLLIKRIER